MSSEWYPTRHIPAAEFFDGRLTNLGVYEHPTQSKDRSLLDTRVLTDGVNCVLVWMSAAGKVRVLSSNGFENDPNKILNAIAHAFNVTLESEHEVEFQHYFLSNYASIIRYVFDEVRELPIGIDSMGRIAKVVIAENPSLARPGNKYRLLDAVRAVDLANGGMK